MNSSFRIGLSFKPRHKIEIEIHREQTLQEDNESTGTSNTVNTTNNFIQNWSIPSQLQIGAHYRLRDWTLISMDVSWTPWSEFYVEGANGEKISNVGGAAVNPDDFEDGFGIRTGFEHSWILPQAIATLRLGAYFDQRPGLRPRNILDNDSTEQADIENWFGFSAGCSYAKPSWVADLGVNWERGNNVGTGRKPQFFVA